MNQKKKILAVVITVIALFLIAAALVTILVVKTLERLEDRWEDTRYEDRDDDKDENDEDEKERPDRPVAEAPEEAPAVDEPAVEAPAVEGDGQCRMGLVLMYEGSYTDVFTNQFAQHCYDLGHTPDVWVVTSDEPAEVFDLSMELIASGVDALAVSCWDLEYTERIQETCQEAGIPFVDVQTPQIRKDYVYDALTIEAWGSPADIAYYLLFSVEVQMEGTGSYAVVALEEGDEVMAELKNMYDWAAGNMQRTGEYYLTGTERDYRDAITLLLETSDVDAILCTDPVVTQVAAELITEMGLDMMLIGFCPAYMLTDYMPQGVACYYDPFNCSELLSYSMHALVNGMALSDGSEVPVPSGITYVMGQYGSAYLFTTGPAYVLPRTIGDAPIWY